MIIHTLPIELTEEQILHLLKGFELNITQCLEKSSDMIKVVLRSKENRVVLPACEYIELKKCYYANNPAPLDNTSPPTPEQLNNLKPIFYKSDQP